MEYLNKQSSEGGDYYTNQDLREFWKFLTWFIRIKRGLAVFRAAPLWCWLLSVSGPESKLLVISRYSRHLTKCHKHNIQHKKE